MLTERHIAPPNKVWVFAQISCMIEDIYEVLGEIDLWGLYDHLLAGKADMRINRHQQDVRLHDHTPLQQTTRRKRKKLTPP